MSTIQRARDIVAATEASLREAIQTALHEQRYGDVAEIAALAEGLRVLLDPSKSHKPPSPAHAPRPTAAPTVPLISASAKKKAPAARKSSYPRFSRDGERLVKTGWSKKNKQEYEHRVPHSAAQAFVAKVLSSTKPGRAFEIETLLPVTDDEGEEIPAYQVYVTLAWLRQAGAIEKKARDGYVLCDQGIAGTGLDKYWHALTDRAES